MCVFIHLLKSRHYIPGKRELEEHYTIEAVQQLHSVFAIISG